ncbi:MAG: substrate-binding domain-containing protein [Candidatus Humimicrobiaceae bacterium]
MTKIKTIKLEDIAKKVGVSITTVSRVLKGNLKVRKEIEKKIRDTAKELGYKNNYLVSSKNTTNDKVGNYYNALIKNIRIRSRKSNNVTFSSDYKWEKDAKNIEKSILWSPSDITARVALVTSGMTHPYWVHQWAMLQKTRDKYFPNIELKLYDAQLDTMKMINDIHVAIREGFEAIIIINHLGSAIYPGYKAINIAKIPLIIYSTGAPSDSYSMPTGDFEYVTVVKPDEVSMGEKLAAYFALVLNGKGNIAIVQGMQESTDNMCRRLGVQNELFFWPDIKIIAEARADWRTDVAYKVMKDILNTFPEPNSINGVISMNDEQTVGVVEAIREANRRKEIIIGSFDAALTGLEMLKNGDLDASVRFESNMEGVLVLDSAIRALKGKKVPIIRRLLSPLITKNNFHQFFDNPTAVIWELTIERDLPWEAIEKYLNK